jgi:hypothetical protein
MKRIITLLFLIIISISLFPQNSKGDFHSSNRNTKNRNDGTQYGWLKIENDASSVSGTPAPDNENVSFYSTSDGIYVSIISGGINKIKLYALTGQLLSNGDLSQGHFFTPTRRGIYFLKINNKTYKVICK